MGLRQAVPVDNSRGLDPSGPSILPYSIRLALFLAIHPAMP
jgi:hypothetical protein